MDYYDDFYKNKKRSGKSRGSIIFTAFVSAIIGGLLVLLTTPTLIDAGYIKLLPASVQQAKQDSLPVNTDVGQNIQIPVNSSSTIVDAVEKVKPAVVGVVKIQKQSNIWTKQTQSVEAGEGSGVVFDKKNGKAYIVTNHHVIDGANDIEVALANGERIPAELLGSDQLTDLAVIAVDEDKVDFVANLGDSTDLKTGEPAIAIGNPLGSEFSQTVTVGVISSNNRTIAKDLNGDGLADWETDVIQTDAAINPGNSGGALVNIEGDVVGINSAKIAETGIEGLGFAIPMSDAKPIIDQLIKDGKVKRPYMGITPYDLHSVSQQDRTNVLKLPKDVNDGVVIYELEKFGPSAMAGLERFDVIIKLDQTEIKSSADLRKYLYKYKKVGEEMKITFYRDGKVQSTKMKLSDFPKPEK